MTRVVKPIKRVEYGDFQTPPSLADRIVDVLLKKKKDYRGVFDPTCGIGNLLYAATERLPSLEKALGIEINPVYVKKSRKRAAKLKLDIKRANFFTTDLLSATSSLPEPYIFLGNPPWVTNATIGQIDGSNLPRKENFAKLGGLDALTGRSNFDVSEWILLRILERVEGTKNSCAMLVKNSVAIKIISYAARKSLSINRCEIYSIDARKEFGASVAACLLYFEGCNLKDAEYSYTFFDNLESRHGKTHSFIGGRFISDYDSYISTERYNKTSKGRWRSGVKHDASKVMDLRKEDGILRRADGAIVDIESDLVFPVLKASDVAKGNTKPRRYTILTQRSIGEDTSKIEKLYPKTWHYLQNNRGEFDRRKSYIYKDRPLFSIFGVGEYSFAPYKIAISGLHKVLRFTLIEPIEGKCVMLDDTCYFLGFDNKELAVKYLDALNSSVSIDFFAARTNWDNKRPIVKSLLDSLDLDVVLANGDKIKPEERYE